MVNIDAPYCQRYRRAMNPAVAGKRSWFSDTMINCASKFRSAENAVLRDSRGAGNTGGQHKHQTLAGDSYVIFDCRRH